MRSRPSLLARRGADLAAARGAAVLVMPALPFGCDQNLMEFPYTVSLSPTTIFRVHDDLIGSLARHGIRKVLLLNGHGGNTGTLDAALRELYGKHKVFLARMDCWTVATDVVNAVRETAEIDHADGIETSVALALFPHFVNMDAAEPSPTNPSRLPLLQNTAEVQPALAPLHPERRRRRPDEGDPREGRKDRSGDRRTDRGHPRGIVRGEIRRTVSGPSGAFSQSHPTAPRTASVLCLPFGISSFATDTARRRNRGPQPPWVFLRLPGLWAHLSICPPGRIKLRGE